MSGLGEGVNDNTVNFDTLINLVTFEASSAQTFVVALALLGLGGAFAASVIINFGGSKWLGGILLALGAWAGLYAYAVDNEFNDKKDTALTKMVSKIEKQTGLTPTDREFAIQQIEALAEEGSKPGTVKRYMGRYDGKPALARLTMGKGGEVTVTIKEAKPKS